MSVQESGAKGLKTEELVRAYFLRAGFFVMRGVKLRHEGLDLTDIDVWVYERSATLARRRTVIDVKDKKIPQAAERLFFAKGVASVIGVEGAGVATTDSRPVLREIARKNNVLWIDGLDLQRLKISDALSGLGRMTEEEFNAEISSIDGIRSSKKLREKIEEVRSSVTYKFGPSSANLALDGFQYFAREAVSAHPNSPSARTLGRLSYLSAAIAAASFDFSSADIALRPSAERVRYMVDIIRFGVNPEAALQNLRWTEAAIRDYLPNGVGLSQIVHDRFWSDVKAIPAEGLAEIVTRQSNSEKLFATAKALEASAYSLNLGSYDMLNVDSKAFLGALLDFVGVDRVNFAQSVTNFTDDHSGNGSSRESENPNSSAKQNLVEREISAQHALSLDVNPIKLKSGD